MRHRLLIAGATLGVVTLSVGLVVSGLPGALTPVPPATLAMSAPAVLARGVATVQPTSVDAVIVSFRHAPADPAKAARLAVRGPAHAIAGASVLSARTLRSDTAEVRLSSYVSRTQAARIASAAQRASQNVRYAEASIRFYPTDAGGSDYYWNLTQVKATTAWTTTRGSADVVVGVIDTGIADNPLLPKALLLSTVDQKVSGRTISGTTWPGLTVTLNYTSGGASQTAVTAVAGDRGNWSATLPKVADDGSTLSASVTDASKASTTTTEAVVNSSTHLTVVTPSIGSTLSGTVDADATVKLTYPDNTTQSATVSGTAWSVTPSATLADGDTVTVTATDSLGNTDTKTITVDRAISLEVDPSNGTVITGATDPGATVTLTTPAGSIDCSSTVTADSDGRFSCTPTAAITDATVVTVTAVDPLGNTTTATVTIDASPHLVVNSPSNGKILSGTADADATVTVTYSDDSTQTASRDGVAWSVTPDTDLADRSTVTVTAVDSLGNIKSAIIAIDRSVKLKVDPSNGKSISGTTDAHATVTFEGAEGHQLCATETADGDGKFSCTPDDQLADGTAVVVTTTDPLGNAATVTLTINASTNLAVNPSNGTTISGSVDTDATVTISDGDTELCADGITVEADGTFSCKPAAALSDGTVVTVTARDSLDNVDTRTVTVDATAPTLTLNPSEGTTISGSTEAGAVVNVHSSDEALCTDIVVPDDGVFTCTPTSRLKDESVVTVTASDSLGNTATAEVTVDRSVHLTVVSPSSGSTLTGTADSDATVIVDYPDGTSQTAKRSDTTWSVKPQAELADGQTVSVTATDTLKNVETSVIVIDKQAPAAPVVTVSTIEEIAGAAEDSAQISLSYTGADGSSATATTSASASGQWSFTGLSPEPATDSSATVTATDAAGNVSAAATTQVSDPTASASATPSPDESSTVEPASVHAAATLPASSTTVVSLTSTTVGSGTVLPGYDFVTTVRSPKTNSDGTVSNQDGDGDARDSDATDNGVDIWTGAAAQPRFSHGTHVAGIIAADGDSGVSGVAPGVKIQPIRALPNSGGGTMSDVSDAIRWAVGESVAGANGSMVTNPYADQLKVLNLSLGASGTTCSTEMQGAIDAATKHGTVVVVSAGNNNSSITTTSPANCKGVIVVTAVNADGSLSAYSNWGTKRSDGYQPLLIAAPGGSGAIDGTCTAWYDEPDSASSCRSYIVSTVKGRWEPAFGTSMAAPHVAATAALLKSVNPSLTPAQIAADIRGTASRITGGCLSGVCGPGIVNAAAAVAAAGTSVTVATTNYATPVQIVTQPKASLAVNTSACVAASSGYPSLTYQWYRVSSSGAEVAISGAASTCYTATSADYGYRLRAKVAATGDTIQATSRLSSVTRGALAYKKRPTVSGTRKVGKTLTAKASSVPSGVAHARYQWLRNGSTIRGATKVSYKLTKKDRRKRISVRVTISAWGYYSVTSTSTRTSPIKR